MYVDNNSSFRGGSFLNYLSAAPEDPDEACDEEQESSSVYTAETVGIAQSFYTVHPMLTSPCVKSTWSTKVSVPRQVSARTVIELVQVPDRSCQYALKQALTGSPKRYKV